MVSAKILKSFLLIGLLSCIACAHAISDKAREQINADLGFARLIDSPEQYKGEKVLLGGRIVRTRNIGEYSEIEVIQKPLDFTGYPSTGDETGGRFIFVISRYLESEFYSKDRLVTGVGKVSAGRVGKIGDSDYQFPVIAVDELHLWEKISRRGPYDRYYPYYYPYYYYPRHFGHSHHFYGHHYY
jgi:outer membrane lipoprotein